MAAVAARWVRATMGVGQGDTMLEERPSPECRLLEDLDSNAFSSFATGSSDVD